VSKKYDELFAKCRQVSKKYDELFAKCRVLYRKRNDSVLAIGVAMKVHCAVCDECSAAIDELIIEKYGVTEECDRSFEKECDRSFEKEAERDMKMQQELRESLYGDLDSYNAYRKMREPEETR